MVGKEIRIQRILDRNSRRTVIVPMDHGMTMGPIAGLEDMKVAVDRVAEGGANAVILHKGIVKSGHREKGKDIGLSSKDSNLIKLPNIRLTKNLKPSDMNEKRGPGEPIFVSDNPLTKLAQAVAREQKDLRDRIERRIEWICAQILNGGAFTDSGTGYAIDFQMPSAHKITLAGGSGWNEAGGDIIGNLRDWRALIAQKTGLVADKLVLGKTAEKNFLNNAKIQNLLDNRRVAVGDLQLRGIDPASGASFLGTVDSIDCYSYPTGVYDDGTGTITDLVPAEKTWLVATGEKKQSDENVNDGTSDPFPIYYGPAEEIDGNIVTDYFSKSWKEENPSAQVLLVEANPLPSMHLPEAVISADVIV